MRLHSTVRWFSRRWLETGRTCLVTSLALGLTVLGVVSSAQAQGIDCARLQAQIAGSGGGNRYAVAARKQSVELARTSAYAHQLGCDRQQFSFFGSTSAPQCGGLNARIAQMQANLGQLQAAGGGGRDDLVTRFNTYCRGGQAVAQQPRQRGFFESLFGGPEELRQPVPTDLPPEAVPDDDGTDAHGGSQAVCVRTCDGSFFPMNMSVRHNGDSLNEMCTALCPGSESAVYTRNPNNDIKTAVSLDGKDYMDLPNALKFQKSFDAACTCKPPGKTWAEALTGAENALGSQRKGDIMVTPEKSAELSRPKLDTKTRSSLLKLPPPDASPPALPSGAQAADVTGDTKAPSVQPDQTEEITGPDGVKRRVRKVGPQL